jgi:mannose-1-phosphate guanylyltransferase
MRALLLAAGFGTRLRPITETTPKCLVHINGRPLLDYWLALLDGAGFTNALVNLHYLSEVVVEFLAQSPYSIKITTVFENSLLGTAGTVLKNRDYFGSEPFMLIHADNLSLFDVYEFKSKFDNRDDNIEITMMTFYTDSPENCGIVEVNEENTVYGFHEKVKNPPGNIANAAVYIIAPSVIDFIKSLDKQIIDFSTDVLPHYIGRINTFYNSTYHRDIGNLDSLSKAQIEYPALFKDEEINCFSNQI